MHHELSTRFEKEIKSGLITLVAVPPNYYPINLMWKRCELERNFNDKMLRVIWRDKQVLDSVYAMHFALSIDGVNDDDWYLQLEDDSQFIIKQWATFVTKWMHQYFPYDDAEKRDNWNMIRWFAEHPSLKTSTIMRVRSPGHRHPVFLQIAKKMSCLVKFGFLWGK